MLLTVTLNPAIDLNLEVEKLRAAEMHRCSVMRRAAGGKGINVSRVAEELGCHTTALLAVGPSRADELGELLKHHAFSIIMVRLQAGTTRQNVVVSEKNGARWIKVNERGPRWTPTDRQNFLREFRRIAQEAAGIVLSGWLPARIPKSFYGQLIREGRRSGAVTFLDAEGETLQNGLRARPDVVKVNRDEAAGALGIRIRSLRDKLEAAATILRAGAGLAVITDADSEAVAVSKDERWIVSPPKIKAISSVGSGDSFLAALAVSLLKGHPLVEAFRWAVAAGSASAMREDTQLCRLSDLKRLLGKVKVRPA
ncbi:MAG: 1-phosphofructokinase family hexose kinase [bacterium]